MDEEKLYFKNSQIDVTEMKQNHWNFKNPMSYYKYIYCINVVVCSTLVSTSTHYVAVF